MLTPLQPQSTCQVGTILFTSQGERGNPERGQLQSMSVQQVLNKWSSPPLAVETGQPHYRVPWRKQAQRGMATCPRPHSTEGQLKQKHSLLVGEGLLCPSLSFAWTPSPRIVGMQK